MSIKLMSAIFDVEIHDLQFIHTTNHQDGTIDDVNSTVRASTAKFVLIALADHSNDYGEGAYPGISRLERKTNLSRQAVIDALEALQKNGLITVNGLSRLGTNNYTINIRSFPKMADEISELPELVSPADQGSMPGVLELVSPADHNHHVTIHKPSTAINVPKIIAKANIAVDHILESAQKSATKTWTSLPEIYHSYGKAFCVSTGLSYHKRYFNDWASTFDEWSLDGYQPSDVVLAVDLCRDKGSDISRPGSITWKLRSMVAQRQPEQSVPNFTGAVDPDEPKYTLSPRLRSAQAPGNS